jgi:hypothetical protein
VACSGLTLAAESSVHFHASARRPAGPSGRSAGKLCPLVLPIWSDEHPAEADDGD